jgi:LytS/YehU family sensor histidine kinase
MQASNAALQFNGPEKVLMISIRPAFWNQWWFRSIIIVFAALIIIGIFRARVKKIKEDAFIQNQLKEMEMKALKAQMNPHFIYNALNSIQALVANDKKDEGIRYIGSFSRLLRQVLDNSENNVISLDKELETIGLYIQLESLRLDVQLQYKKIIPENIVPEFEKIPPLILQPFVENALWHGLSRKAGEKEIKITVSLNAEWLICDIRDNGIGREKAGEWKNNSAAIHESKGLDITRKRLIDYNENGLIAPIEFFDLYDDYKNPAGTLVTVRIKRKFNSISV